MLSHWQSLDRERQQWLLPFELRNFKVKVRKRKEKEKEKEKEKRREREEKEKDKEKRKRKRKRVIFSDNNYISINRFNAGTVIK